LNEFKK